MNESDFVSPGSGPRHRIEGPAARVRHAAHQFQQFALLPFGFGFRLLSVQLPQPARNDAESRASHGEYEYGKQIGCARDGE